MIRHSASKMAIAKHRNQLPLFFIIIIISIDSKCVILIFRFFLNAFSSFFLPFLFTSTFRLISSESSAMTERERRKEHEKFSSFSILFIFFFLIFFKFDRRRKGTWKRKEREYCKCLNLFLELSSFLLLFSTLCVFHSYTFCFLFFSFFLW